MRLFRPDWLIADFVPALSILKKSPTILLLIVVVLWLQSNIEKKDFKLLGAFLVLIFFSALFAENTGRSRIILREVFEFYLLTRVTITFIDSDEKIDILFKLFMLYFPYYALWGFMGNGRVAWDNVLDEEDAYGPLMCMGVAYCYNYFFAVKHNAFLKIVALAGVVLCIFGVVQSFARGAFLALAGTIFILWFRSTRKILGLIVVGLSVCVLLVAANQFFPDNKFWKEMSTISEGTSKGTGSDRKILWTTAWLMFKDYPVFGVGPLNYGMHASEYVVKIPDRKGYLDPRRIWGRAIHNAYFQILSEQGSVGMLIFLLILYDFMRKNKKNKLYGKSCEADRNEDYKYLYIATGLEVGMAAYLMNAFFYDITYYTWFWNLIILNLCLFIILDAKKCAQSL